tara:strand:+ start:2639 stop:3316 length:678 start_codon:yes stop_codon:yes gene_type:complete
MFGDPWQEDLARFQILTMRAKTKVPFELVIAETESNKLQDLADQYSWAKTRSTYTADFNAGLALSTGKFKVHIGIDVFPGQDWLEALLECFDKFKDCGAATIAMGEPGASIGPFIPRETFDEAMYGPLMMFREGWTLDPMFPDQGSDNDLVLRMYNVGLRSYRNNRTKGFHMNGITWETAFSAEERNAKVVFAKTNFEERHGDSPLAMYRMMMRGRNEYGREYWG